MSRSEEHTSELQSRVDLVCRLLLEKKKKIVITLCDGKKKKIEIDKERIVLCEYYSLLLFSYLLFSYCSHLHSSFLFFFFFNDTATTEIYTLSLHDALPISPSARAWCARSRCSPPTV